MASCEHSPRKQQDDILAAGNRKRKRVVPDELRRRTAISCDRCKLRRAKCIRASGTERCGNCEGANVECKSTLPRKHRVYGSLESLSLRYRVLDALVRGLLPGEDVGDVEELVRLGRKRGFDMPGSDEQSTNPEIFEGGNAALLSPISPPTPQTQLPDQSISGSSCTLSETSARQLRREKLVPTPHGVGHYVGPSSSLGFAATVRKMAARCSKNANFLLYHRQQEALRSDFLTMKVSKTLEPVLERREDEPVLNGELICQSKCLLLDILPPRATADALVQAFFDRVHPDYPLFHRTIFQLRYEAFWDPNRDPNMDLETGWICCMCLVFVFGAQSLEKYDKKESMLLQRRYLNVARSFVDQLVSTTSLNNIQALLLLQLYYHNVGERNASWMFLGCASRMAIALGMHREGANIGFDSLERNIRKTVWWTLYIFERNLCIMLGRPSTIEEAEISISFPDEAIESSMGLPNLTAAMATLSRISYRVKKELYSPSDTRSSNDEEALAATASDILRDLQNWHAALPAHLRIGWNAVHSHQSRAIRLLDMLYNHTRCMVTRPFLLNSLTTSITAIENSRPNLQISPTILHLSSACISSAENVLAQAHLLNKDGLLNGTSWLDVYYIYHACFLLCLRPIAHPISEPEPPLSLSHKESVRDILLALRVIPLASTMRTLLHVAAQVANLIGALHDLPPHTSSSSCPSLSPYPEPHLPPTAASDPSNQTPQPPHTYPPPHPATVPALPVNANPNDWMQAAQSPWDFLGRTTYGLAGGFSQDWCETQAGTWDDMMFPTVVGGTFGVMGR